MLHELTELAVVAIAADELVVGVQVVSHDLLPAFQKRFELAAHS